MPSDTPTPAEIAATTIRQELGLILALTSALTKEKAPVEDSDAIVDDTANLVIAALSEHYHLLPKAGLSISVTRAADVAEEQR